MKKDNFIFESQGIVEKDGMQWRDLSKVISIYIIDKRLDDKNISRITLKQIENFYEKNYQSINSRISIKLEKVSEHLIPDWIDDFTIKIEYMPAISCRGAFDETSVVGSDGKISFNIYINKSIYDNPANVYGVYEILMHEFLHAYTSWLNIYKKANIYNKDYLRVYDHIHKINKTADKLKIWDALGKLPASGLTNKENINFIFNNETNLKFTLAQCFYFSSVDEIRSFKHGYTASIRLLIPYYFNNKERFKDNAHLYEYNNTYLQYKALHKFAEILEMTPVSNLIAKDVIEDLRPMINYILKKNISADLFSNYKNDVQFVIKKLARVFKKTFSDVLQSMRKIFYKDYIDLKPKYEQEENLINESQGIVDKDGILWFDLSELIVDYIFDLLHGLNNEGENVVTKGNIESYYLYVYKREMPSYIIPEWIGSFKIYLKDSIYPKGTFINTGANLNDKGLLVFKIELKDTLDPDSMSNTLVHEFQHAYTKFLELTKKTHFHTKRTVKLYKLVQNTFTNSDEHKKISMAKKPFIDFVEINDNVFNNPKDLKNILLFGIYSSDNDEIRSFIQEFAIDIMHKIEKKIYPIKDEIKKALEFKGDFNNLAPKDKWKSNILNNISISCYDSQYYTRYKAFYNFYKKLLLILLDDKVADEVVYSAKKAFKLFLNIPVYKKLPINFDGDSIELIKKVAKKEIILFEKVLRKMEHIFAKLISEIPVK